MGKKVVTLGEIMLRLSTPGNTRFVQSDSFDVVYGGGEANVAVSCANYGHDAYFVTKLPKHEIGQSAVNALRKYGVKTDFIARGGDRVGIYYLETGASMQLISTSMPLWKVPIGSTGQVLLLLSLIKLPNLPNWLVKLQNVTVLRFLLTSTSVRNSGQKRKLSLS